MNNIERIIGNDTYNKLMCMDLYSRSLNLVNYLFNNKYDKDGKPYIHHLSRVSFSMSEFGTDGMIAGLLHDVVEDIDGMTFEDLKEFGIPEIVIDAIRFVTKEKNTRELSKEEKLKIYNNKIDSIINSGNILAINLKYNDMKDNYDKERLKNLSPELQEWFKLKYEDNLNKLRDALYNINIQKTKIKIKEMRNKYDRY